MDVFAPQVCQGSPVHDVHLCVSFGLIMPELLQKSDERSGPTSCETRGMKSDSSLSPELCSRTSTFCVKRNRKQLASTWVRCFSPNVYFQKQTQRSEKLRYLAWSGHRLCFLNLFVLEATEPQRTE